MNTYVDDFDSMDPDKWPVTSSVTSGKLSIDAAFASQCAVYLVGYAGTTGFVQCAVCDRIVEVSSGESIRDGDPRLCEHLTGVQIHFGPGETI